VEPHAKSSPVRGIAEPPSPLRLLGDELGSIAERFPAKGAVGFLVVDASPLLEVEAVYGTDAHERSLQALVALVREAAGGALHDGDLVLAGDVGRREVLALLFRDSGANDLNARLLPALAAAIRHALVRQRGRVFYPYIRRAPELAIGYSVALRNPKLSPATQVRRAVDRARADADLNARITERVQRQRLLQVVLSGRIHSVYEPVVDAKGLTVFGYEALARGPAGTPLASPLELFGVAEREDLVFELDCLCRQKALEGAVDFPAGTKLFLNFRPSAIHDPSFQPQALCQTLERCQLRPSDVVFELSEQESIQNFDVFRQARDEYGRLGFQFALDDMGAGYASFQSVVELAPEFVKVDRAFVHGIDEDPARQAILQGFQSIADRIHARIIGEGLDTLEELQTLGQLGIQFGQGWLFGKPTPLRPTR
jgi:EAL domain-containing protein (putative c-di-GMP-specific phosphodiesterase class I)